MSITSELRDFVDGLACHKVTRDLLRDIADRINGKVASDYVQLPKDAEGIPFHVGDHVEVPDGLPSEGKPWQVGTITRLDLGAMCWHVRVIAGGMYHDYLIENVRHYHQPTVEDVLQKLLEQAVGYSDAHTTVALNTIAEYAAKLRLAGEDA